MVATEVITMVYGNMTSQELAALLGFDRRQVERRAQHGEIPCQMVGGQFRFNRGQIHAWLSQTIGGMDRKRLAQIDAGIRSERRIDAGTGLLGPLLNPVGVDMVLDARTKGSALRKLATLATDTGLVYDRDALVASVLQREELGSTALPGGLAIPHPRQPLRYEIADSFVVVARTRQPLAYGAPDGGLTDLLFLMATQDAHHHLHLLARLCRILQDPRVCETLRETEDPGDVVAFLTACERDLLR